MAAGYLDSLVARPNIDFSYASGSSGLVGWHVGSGEADITQKAGAVKPERQLGLPMGRQRMRPIPRQLESLAQLP